MTYKALRYRQILNEPDNPIPDDPIEFTWPLERQHPESLGQIKQLVVNAVEKSNLVQLPGLGFMRLADNDGVLYMHFWRGLNRPEVHTISVKRGLAILSPEGGGHLPLRPPDAVMRVWKPETIEELPVLEATMATDTYEAWEKVCCRVDPSQSPRPVSEVVMSIQMNVAWTWLLEYEKAIDAADEGERIDPSTPNPIGG